MPHNMNSEEDYFSKLERKKLILSFVENGDWKRVLEYYDTDYKFREPLLVWIKPSLDLLIFIEETLRRNLGIEKVCIILAFRVCSEKKIISEYVKGIVFPQYFYIWTNCLIIYHLIGRYFH